ncbi:MAG: hypothetical protein ABEJ69_02305 [Candidatus Nanohaloarchaea archaeon]
MRRKILLLFLILFAVQAAAGQVNYVLDSDADQVVVNTSVKLGCDGECPGRWDLSWSRPKNAEIVSITARRGEVTDYEITGDRLSIRTRGSGGNPEIIDMSFRVTRDAEEIHQGLYKRELSLPALSGERTQGILYQEELISGWASFGFGTSYTNTTMKFRGNGSLILRWKFGNGTETEYFQFFGGSHEGTDVAYEVPVGTMGFYQEFKRFPVAVLPDEKYNRTVNRWSAGEYVGGVIRIRESLEDDFVPVLAHEVVHGLNDRELKWDATSSTYFDEGVGKYIEFLVHRKLYNESVIDKKPAELFGEPVRYDPDPTDRTYYTIPSKGDKDRLWQYYQENRSFMKNWAAFSSEPPNRGFGYAYSELMIRNYIVHQNGSLRGLYRELNVTREVKDPDVKWSIYSEHMDMTPCKYGSREKFNACLEEINHYNYPTYSAPERNATELVIEKLELPNREKPAVPKFGSRSLERYLQALLEWFKAFLQDVAASF